MPYLAEHRYSPDATYNIDLAQSNGGGRCRYKDASRNMVMNAVGNMLTPPFAFKCLLSHEERTSYWVTWTEAKQRDVLSILRTGERAKMVNDMLAELRSDQDPAVILLDGLILLNDRKFRHRDGVCPSPTDL